MFWRQRNRIIAVLALALVLLALPASAASRHRSREASQTVVSGIWEQVLTWLQSLKSVTSPTSCQGESGGAIDPNGCPQSATVQHPPDSGSSIDPNGVK